MPNPQQDERFQLLRAKLQSHLEEWNQKLVASLQKKGKYQQFLDLRAQNALDQLLSAEKLGRPIDVDEVEQEMHPEAEPTAEDEELRKQEV